MIDISTPLQVGQADLTIVAGTLGLALAASLLVVWSVRKYLAEYTKKTKTRIDDMIVSVLRGPVVFFIIAYGLIILVRSLAGNYPSQSAGLLDSLGLAYAFTLVLVGTWLAAELFIVMWHRYLETLTLKTQTKTDDIVVGALGKTGKILILAVGVTIALALLWMTVGLLRLAAGQ